MMKSARSVRSVIIVWCTKSEKFGEKYLECKEYWECYEQRTDFTISQNFAKSALVKPIEVNVGRAGAANLDVFQEVEYVKQEAKIMYLLECLQKTPPLGK